VNRLQTAFVKLGHRHITIGEIAIDESAVIEDAVGKVAVYEAAILKFKSVGLSAGQFQFFKYAISVYVIHYFPKRLFIMVFNPLNTRYTAIKQMAIPRARTK